MTRRWIHYLTDRELPVAGTDAVSLLGGKGAGLWEMTKSGLPIPPGFTITVDACREYFACDQRWPDGLEREVRQNLRRLEAETGREFGRGDCPLWVAVRSGAARSMPGMMDTILNCGREAVDPWQALLDAIDAVFQSWQSQRAAAYRRQHAMTNLPGTAVNVQAMFPSDVSGVLFTRDPTAPSADRMVIEGWYGLGEAVVSGDVTPDRFVIHRSTLEPIEIALGPRPPKGEADAAPCLRLDQVSELGRLAQRVEQHFDHPVDIEWAWAAGQFALLQSREIRGLDAARQVETGRQAEISRLRRQTEGTRRLWVVHNLAEILPAPTPLTWDVVQRFMAGDGGFGRLYRQLGYRPSPEVCKSGFLELICGRIYADPDRQCDLFWDGMPFTYDLDAVASQPRLLDQMPTQFAPDRADGRFLLKLIQHLPAMWRSSGRLRRLKRQARPTFLRQVLPDWLDYVRGKRSEDLTRLDDQALLAELHSRRRHVLNEFAPESLKPGFFGGMALDSLRSLLCQLLGRGQAEALVSELTLSLDGDTTFEQNRTLEQVASGDVSLESFLDRFGHRCVGEMELMTPRWREDPEIVQVMANRLAEGDRPPLAARHLRNARRREQAKHRLPEILKQAGGSCFREQIEQDLSTVQSLLPFRESGKHYLMMGYELIRIVVETLAARWPIGEGIYFLTLDELDAYPGDSRQLEQLARERRKRWQAFRQLDLPEVIDSQRLDDLGTPQVVSPAARLDGVPLAGGVTRGTAQVVKSPANAGDLGSGYVLVCPSTDPGWTPLFAGAAGLIVERGGILSHGAIVARDFGIPAVACPDATRRLSTGQRVRVDGNTGDIVVLDE